MSPVEDQPWIVRAVHKIPNLKLQTATSSIYGFCHLGECVDDSVVDIGRVQVTVVVQENFHQSLGGLAEGCHHVQHLPFVLESAVLRLQHTKEHGGDEHLDLRLQVRLLGPS